MHFLKPVLFYSLSVGIPLKYPIAIVDIFSDQAYILLEPVNLKKTFGHG